MVCLFIDFNKAYDSLNRKKIWSLMEKFGIPKKLIKLSRLSVINSRCKVRVNGEMSEDFGVDTGVRQGDGLSPILFNLALETALQQVKKSDVGIKIGKTINILAFADDVVIMAENIQDLKELTKTLIEETKKVGLTINEKKTKFMKINREQDVLREEELNVENYKFGEVKHFTYLGVILSSTSKEENEIRSRITTANRCFMACNRLMSSKMLSRKTKIRIYKTIIRPILLYGAETWVLNKREEKAIIVFENKVLRKIFGPTFEEGEWRKKHSLIVKLENCINILI